MEYAGVNEVIDNCQHVLLGCCTNLIDFYERTGVAGSIRWFDRLTFLEPGGRASEIGKPRFHLSVDYACIHFIVDLLDDLDRNSLWRTNAVGTKNVIRLQERLKFRLIHFSSSEVYGDWPELMVETVMDEHEIKQMNDYAMTKWVNEQQIMNSAAMFGTESVVVRLFNTYGPGEYYSPYRSVNCRFLYCALNGLPWTVFRGHSRTSTYLADTVRTSRVLRTVGESFQNFSLVAKREAEQHDHRQRRQQDDDILLIE